MHMVWPTVTHWRSTLDKVADSLFNSSATSSRASPRRRTLARQGGLDQFVLEEDSDGEGWCSPVTQGVPATVAGVGVDSCSGETLHTHDGVRGAPQHRKEEGKGPSVTAHQKGRFGGDAPVDGGRCSRLQELHQGMAVL
jgi:hypothetical protein